MKTFRLLIPAVSLLVPSCPASLSAQQQEPAITLVEECGGIRSDRRPIPVGYYDKDVRQTFVCWMGADSHPRVKAYDHPSATWGETLTPARSPFADKHNYPALLQGTDGRAILFYGCHNSTLKMAVAPMPHSLEGKWEERFIPQAERASYPAPVLTGKGILYVFYRDTRRQNGHTDDRPYCFVRSDDGGRTWTRRLLVDPYPRTTDNMTEVYNGQVSYQRMADGSERIHLAWTLCGEKLGRHAHATYGRNVYYAYLNPANDHIYNIEGRDLGTMLDNKEADRYCLAFETPIPARGHSAGLQVSVHYRDNGFPLIHHQYPQERGGRLITWTGQAWHHTSFPAQGEPRGIEKLGPDCFRLYATMTPGLVAFLTEDGGLTVKREYETITPESLSRCYVIQDAQPELKLLLFSNPVGKGAEKLSEGNRNIYMMSNGAETR